MTNFEKIKQMSVEEMADMFYSIIPSCDNCHIVDLCRDENILHCRRVIRKWLESEAEE